jgi:anaerobic magnesium-protoporphyrin IX monomethyl ester cyclase
MNACRILLIDVNKVSLDTSKDMLEYPLGLLYLASALKNAFGDQVQLRIETFDVRHHRNEQVALWINDFCPDIVGFRSLTMGKNALHTLARIAKIEYQVPLVVAGGPHATDSPLEVMSNEAFDAAAIGEGENTIVDIVTAYMHGESLSDIKGLAARTDQGIRLNPQQTPVPDLDQLPPPDHSVIDFKRINKGHVDFSFRYNVPHANLFTSRGCPYECIYCHHVFGKRFRFHSPQRMFEEVKLLYEREGIRTFQIIDDIFNMQPKRALQFFDLIARSNMAVTFSFPNGVRGDIIDQEMVDAMWAGGVRYIAFAVETGSPRLQKLIKKHLHLDKIRNAISLSTARGIVTRGFFMFGFPTETEDEVSMTIDFATSSDLVLALFFTVLYFPGTPLYTLARSLVDIDRLDLGLEDDYVRTREGPYDFSKDKLEELKLRAIRSFFFSDKRLRLFYTLVPNFYSQRDADSTMLVNIISGNMRLEDMQYSVYAERLKRHFMMADRFSDKSGFYV